MLPGCGGVHEQPRQAGAHRADHLRLQGDPGGQVRPPARGRLLHGRQHR
jgi:hypothetical protein